MKQAYFIDFFNTSQVLLNDYYYDDLLRSVPNGPRAPLEGASRDPTCFARKGPSLPYSLRSGGGHTDTRTLDFIYI